jgi:acyl phosphate:glycerol-3-phosphate acyltransferase
VKLRWGLAAVLGYAIGLLPTAQLVTRLVRGGGVDVTSRGTRNPGAANVARVVGRRAAAVVFLGDAGKGIVAGMLGRRVAGPVGVHAGSAAALVAHCYPITRPGAGGKGVATSVGQVLVAFPAYFPIDAAVAGLTYYAPPLKRDPQLATNVASIAWVTCGLVWWRRRWANLWGPAPTPALAVASALSAAVIAVRFGQTASPPALNPEANTPPEVGTTDQDSR